MLNVSRQQAFLLLLLVLFVVVLFMVALFWMWVSLSGQVVATLPFVDLVTLT